MALPVLVMVMTLIALEVPTATTPKSITDGENETTGPALTTPAFSVSTDGVLDALLATVMLLVTAPVAVGL